MAGITLDAGHGKKSEKKAGRGAMIILFLFATPFAAGGTIVAYLAVSMVVGWWEARSWVEVRARIISADLNVSHGDDSTTYSVAAEYTYEWEGRTYTSQRVSTSFGSDNVGSFHQDKYAELQRYAGTSRLFRCFVDPDNPSEAMLYRELRWGMLGFMGVFAGAFGLVGYGLMFVAVYGGRLVKETDRLKEARPKEPWLWDADWVDGRITAGSRGAMIGAIIFATLWNTVSAPLLFLVPREVADGNLVALLGALFPLIGFGLAWWAVYATLQWRKFGNSEFEMYANPGVLGGWLQGRIHTNIRKRPDGPFRLTLSCLRKETRGSGKNRSTTERTLWQETARVPPGALLAGPNGVGVPVRFGIPYKAGPQSDPEASDPVEWRLEVSADLPGIDYGTHFTVPVFRTPDSDRAVAVEALEPDYAAAAAPPPELSALGIIRKPTAAGGVQYVFRRARAKKAALMLTAFTIVWCGFIWLMLGLDAPIFFPIIFGLFALLMVAGLSEMCLKQTRVEVANGRLAFNSRYLGPGRTRFFGPAEIAAVKVAKGMQANTRLYYRVVLHTRDDQEHRLAAMIGDKGTARRIVADLQEALGVAGGAETAPGTLAEEPAT
jgi:hypothetical protein